MNHSIISVFDLPGHLSAKAAPELIAADELHFAAIAESLDESIADLSRRLEQAQQAPARLGQELVERDLLVHRLHAELRTLRRYGIDLCLGRSVGAGGERVYIGRLGLLDKSGRQLLIDWRSPDAEAFFGATHANPMGLTSRRRFRWTRGRISDYWDEVFTADGLATNAALDDQSAFIASLGTNRSPRMRDVLGTIQADQDAIIRAGSAGALVVDGGPGTGKTVVALHRTAYLLYANPALRHRVLFVGPHDAYLAYVADVLPSLGEDSVQLATLRDFVDEGTTAVPENDPEVARLKSTTGIVRAIDEAVRFYERPPTTPMTVATDWADVRVTAADWAEAFDAPEPGTPHNEAREQIWELLLTIVVDKHDSSIPAARIRKSVQENDELRAALDNSWILIEAAELVADLWSVPAYLRKCAPWLSPGQVRTLQRDEPTRWTTADLPLLDAARRRLGDPTASRRDRINKATIAAQRARMADVIDEAIATDESEMYVMWMLRGDDLRNSLEDETALVTVEPDRLAGPFAHIVVDEAQELTDAEWQALVARCPTLSFTIVGDRAQARQGFTESWAERLARVGLDNVDVATLNINYRTPEEVMAAAEPVIRAVLPDANVPLSIRSTGVAVERRSPAERDAIVDGWLDQHADGIACVIGDPTFAARPRVRSLSPALAKGLEFDLVVLVAPDGFGTDIAGGVDRYVAMTRATQRLVILE